MPDRRPDPTKNPPPDPALSPDPEPMPDPVPDAAPESPLKARIRSMFETPQKARITITCLVVGLITFVCIIVYIIYVFQNYYPADTPPNPSLSVSDAPAQSGDPDESDALGESPEPSHMMGLVPTLTIDQARALALQEAEVTEDEVEVTREALTEDHGIWVYEFRFNTGAVRSMLKETIVYPSPELTEPPVPTDTDPAETEPQPSDTAEPLPTPSELPADSQPPASPEPTPSPSPSPTPAPSQSTMYIGMDRAKAAALDHAGLSAPQVAFTRLHMSREDGRMVYQIEFRQGDVRYAYKIDASTGRVLEHSAN